MFSITDHLSDHQMPLEGNRSTQRTGSMFHEGLLYPEREEFFTVQFSFARSAENFFWFAVGWRVK